MIRLALAAFIAATPAVAQDCPPLDQAAEMLTQYGESPVSEGLDGQGNLVLFWVNPDTRTWTITVTLPSGATCFIAAGTDYGATAQEPNV